MNELRWILIVSGIALLAGIYYWGRRREAPEEDKAPTRAGQEASPRPLREPKLEPASYAPPDDPDDDGYPLDEPEPVLAEDEMPEQDWPAPRPQSTPAHGRQAYAVRDEVHDDFSADDAPTAADDLPDYRRARREPTLGELSAAPASQPRTAQPQREPAPAPKEAAARRPERRKILALRLSLAPQGIEGGRLLEVFEEELLEHGRYNVFHRLHEDGEALFSIASMIEPGTFDPEQMAEVVYPGITLFSQLPGPVAGMHALNEMVNCARRMQHALGGVLQDDRGVTLTEHRVERMREEVREFERPPGARAAPVLPPR